MVLSRGQNMKNRNIFTKMSCSIGEFNMIHYQPMLKKYAYYRMLMCLLVRHECKQSIIQAFFSEINAIMTERDYSEELKSQFDMEFKSQEFGFKFTISTEGSTCEYHYKYCNGVRNEAKANIDFQSRFS